MTAAIVKFTKISVEQNENQRKHIKEVRTHCYIVTLNIIKHGKRINMIVPLFHSDNKMHKLLQFIK